ncbi:MAG: hypothetical protein H6907_00745 [Hyphomicrobiales bacterium]|nr:hypothetical protein [Hyphomicrobiales bacterium]
MLITSRLDELERWRAAIADDLDRRGIAARFVHLWGDRDLGTLARAACRDHATILVAAAAAPLLQGDSLQRLLDQTESSVLLVR